MAEIIVKSIKSDKEPKIIENGLENIPKSEKTDKIVKSINKRGRVGHWTPPNPITRAKIVEDGSKVK